jgi:cellulose synthase/poly-beta-1,6-N-acetylglucosamine synthase-like glycosyltransferase
MHEALVTLGWFLAAIPTLLLLVFTLEVWLGICQTSALDLGAAMPETCILIPAHDEAAIIAQTLERLRPLLSRTTRALIVADNCTDETAVLARNQGFEVLERHDAQQRGKGYALAFGRDHLRVSPPECVIVMDADCYSDQSSITALARRACLEQAAVQARYAFEPGLDASPKVQISNFALWIKNVVRQRGACRMGGGAILTGTGMAFAWPLFERMPLATGNIVEDLALTVDLARSADAPLFLEQALVTSPAASEQATLGQRSRWEHGFLAVARGHGVPLLAHGLASTDRKTILLGMHLLVPPLALLITLSTLIAALLAAIAALTGNWLPFALLTTTFAGALVGILVNWLIEGHEWLKPSALLGLPLYLAWKLPVYGRFLSGKKVEWVRTDRE